MKMSAAVDEFIADRKSQGRISSTNTEKAYRAKLNAHIDDVENRDPAKTGRRDVKATLRRWEHPNSQRQAHAVLTSFYDWCMEEGFRRDNPARQVSRAKARQVDVYRMTRTEVLALLAASEDSRRDRWVAYLGVCAGARAQEIRGFQGRHFQREGWVWISKDIGKGHRERWVPVLPDLEPIIREIRLQVGPDEFVLPGRRYIDPPLNTVFAESPDTMLSHAALYKQVVRLGGRAGIAGNVTPHTLRHAFGDHIGRGCGERVAQALMGHVKIDTTVSTYMDHPTLDELAVAVQGFTYRKPVPEAA